ncbi:hypothetical protein GOODEAATRI_029132 [Goodea atripinnis]|uniref:Uncharacterized protein n=1 Tax=Goodea atripinnis TaxID=208336 RepID=A0ABV0Q206_9TELE
MTSVSSLSNRVVKDVEQTPDLSSAPDRSCSLNVITSSSRTDPSFRELLVRPISSQLAPPPPLPPPALILSLTLTFQLFTQTKQELNISQSQSIRCDQVWVVMTMLSCVLRMGKSSSLTRPKELLKETKRIIYSKPPRHRIGAAVSN